MTRARDFPTLLQSFFTTSDRPTKGESAYDRFLSGYFSFAATLRAETIAQAAIAARHGEPERALCGGVLT